MPTLMINFTNSCNTFKVSDEMCVTEVKDFYRALATKYHPLLNASVLVANAQLKTIDATCENLPWVKLPSSKVSSHEIDSQSREQAVQATKTQETQAQMYGIFIDALLGNTWV